jgi:flagella basal body P-ring formation protein FlgA
MLLVMSLTLPMGANANERQALASIQQTAVQAVRSALHPPAGGRLRLRAQPVDPRLQLRACGGALEGRVTQTPARGGRIAVQVACPDPGGWKLFVTVDAEIMAPVAVAARDLPRGVALSSGDLVLETRELARLPWGHVSALEPLIGQVLRRPIRAGEAVPPSAASAPPLVRTGERVVIESGSGPISVRIDGVALADGRAGDRVRVRNLGTSRIIEGRVEGEGHVHIGP